MTVFYRFRHSGVSIAAPPKTGCTSVLSFLVNLETQLGLRDDATRPGDATAGWRPAGANPSDSAGIHGDPRLKGCAVDAESPIAEGELRLATIRDPAERIASCWLDKVVDGPSAWQAKYFAESWFPQDFRTPKAVEASFLAFLAALRSDRALLHSDPHWAPQCWLLRNWQGARCITTEQLKDLPLLVMQRLNGHAGMPTPPMPHMHRTNAWLKQFLLTPQARSLIGEIYSGDDELVENHSEAPRHCSPGPQTEFNAEDALRLPDFDRKVHLRRTRRLSESLAAMLHSTLWRRLAPTHDDKTARRP